MVRGPAAVLALVALVWVYFVVPEQLPEVRLGVAAGVGAALVAVVAVAVASLAGVAFVTPLFLLGSALIAGALDAADVGAAASVPETVAFACAGMLFAVLLDVPALLVAVPLLVAGVDVINVLSGPSHLLDRAASEPGDPFGLDLPRWGTGTEALRLGFADVAFLGVFAAWAWRRGLRPAVTAVGMVAGLVAAVVVSVETDRAIPQLTLLAAGFLAPNLPALGRLVRAEAG